MLNYKRFLHRAKNTKIIVEDDAHKDSKLILLSANVKELDLSDFPEKNLIQQQFGVFFPTERFETIVGYDQLTSGTKESHSFSSHTIPYCRRSFAKSSSSEY